MAGLPIVAICLLNQRLLDRSIFRHAAVCPHGKNIGKLGTGKRRNGEYAEAFSMNKANTLIHPNGQWLRASRQMPLNEPSCYPP